MLNFRQFITEGNELQQRINKHVSNGVGVGAISPEGAHTSTPEKKKGAHEQIRNDLESARKSGHIGGWTGPHKGQYQYGGEHEVSHEGSYIVHAAGNTDEHHKTMVGALSRIGNKHKQESVLSVDKEKNANWHHLDASEKKGQTEYKGKLKYNVPLSQKSPGRTLMKRGSGSFTSKE